MCPKTLTTYFLAFSVFIGLQSCAGDPEVEEIEKSQFFAAEYGNPTYTDAGWYGMQTSDSCYILLGQSTTHRIGQQSLLLIKTDKYGDPIWTSIFGADSVEAGYTMTETRNQEYLISGYTNSFGDDVHDILLLRVSNTGELIWSRVFGGYNFEYGKHILELESGDILLAGYTYSYGVGEDDMLLMKLNSEGDTLWTRFYGEELNEHGCAIDVHENGDIILSGHTVNYNAAVKQSEYTFADHYVIRLNSEGDTIWTRVFGGEHHDRSQFVKITPEGDYIIAGLTESFTDYSDVLLTKMSPEGELIWSKCYSGPFTDASYSVDVTPAGGYLITGESGYSEDKSNRAGLMILTDSNGDTLHTMLFSSEAGNTIFSTGKVTSAPGYMAVGKGVVDTGSAFGLIMVHLDSNFRTGADFPHADIKVIDAADQIKIGSTETLTTGGIAIKDHAISEEKVDCAVRKL